MSANKVSPKAGLNGFDRTFVRVSTLGSIMNFCAKNHRHRQYPNRWRRRKSAQQNK